MLSRCLRRQVARASASVTSSVLGRHVARASTASVLHNVPVIDVSEVLASDLPHKDMAAVAQIRDAASKWGFFQIVNHGVDDELMERFYRDKTAFFARPTAEKASIKRNDTNSKGWYDDELTKNKQDWKEGFDIGAQDGSLDKAGLDGFNQWPSDPVEFQATIREYYDAMEVLSRKLLCCMSLGLGLEAEHFCPEFDQRHSSYLRLNHYPVCPDPSAHRAISEHTDAGALTVLEQSNVQSLQVLLPEDGEWHDVPPLPGALVINTGDIMQVWSNDVYKAPLHRVKANADQARSSSPFFYNPSYETDYCPQVVSAARPARYRPINWGKFRLARFAGDYADVGLETQIAHFRIDSEVKPEYARL